MSAEPVASRAEPACPNCGYSRKGLASEGAACPECGAAPPSGSEAWLRTMRSSMTILCWAIPAMLLAWASPSIFVVGREGGTMPMVAGPSWLMLFPAATIAFAIAQVGRCMTPTALTRWSPRVFALAIIALISDAAGAKQLVVSTVSTIKDANLGWSYRVWGPVLWLTLSAGAMCGAIVLARALRDTGLPRVHDRVRRVALFGVGAIVLLTIFWEEGLALRPPEPSVQSIVATRGNPPGELARDLFDVARALAGFLSPVFATALATVTWHGSALARRQLHLAQPASHPLTT